MDDQGVGKMLYYADQYVRPGATLTADVCVIGSGAAGISLAHRLLGTGKRVIVLEGSRLSTVGLFTDAHLEILQRYGAYPPEVRDALPVRDESATCQSREHRYSDDIAQELYAGTEDAALNTIDPEFLTCSRIRVYGGTTNCWGGWTRPLAAVDFDRSDLSPTNAWPVTRDQIMGYYQLAMNYCSLDGLSVYDYDKPSNWIGKTSAPIELMPVEQASSGVLQNSGFTSINPARWNFQSVWGPALQMAPSNVCTVLRNANVRFLEPAAGGASVAQVHVSTIDYTSSPPRPGFDFTVKAGAYVVACGGTETPRLLLNSAPGGLGNKYGTLGKCFMIHPLNTGAAVFSAGPKRPSSGIMTAYSNWTTATPPAYDPNVWITLTPTEQTLRKLRLRNFRAIVRFSPSGGGTIDLNWEQAPNPDSQVVLDQRRDPIFGDPLVRLNWTPTIDDTTNTPKQALSLVSDALKALGYSSTLTPSLPYITWDGDHHMGATRMSASPANGYVNADCRAHMVDNLYVASSSVWATSGYANPTLSIITFALRLADRLSGRTVEDDLVVEGRSVAGIAGG